MLRVRGMRPFNKLRGSRECMSFMAAIIFWARGEEARGQKGSVRGKPHTEAMVEMRARRREGQVDALMSRLVRVERWVDF